MSELQENQLKWWIWESRALLYPDRGDLIFELACEPLHLNFAEAIKLLPETRSSPAGNRAFFGKCREWFKVDVNYAESSIAKNEQVKVERVRAAILEPRGRTERSRFTRIHIEDCHSHNRATYIASFTPEPKIDFELCVSKTSQVTLDELSAEAKLSQMGCWMTGERELLRTKIVDHMHSVQVNFIHRKGRKTIPSKLRKAIAKTVAQYLDSTVQAYLEHFEDAQVRQLQEQVLEHAH